MVTAPWISETERAAAEAMGDVWATRINDEDGSTSLYARSVDDLARVAVAAVVPILAEAVARRIDQAWAVVADSAPNPGRSREVQGFLDGMETAEDIARNVGREVSG